MIQTLCVSVGFFDQPQVLDCGIFVKNHQQLQMLEVHPMLLKKNQALKNAGVLKAPYNWHVIKLTGPRHFYQAELQ